MHNDSEPSVDSEPTDPPELSYAAAMAELESILDALDGDALDVDGLATKVARAALLIDHCRSRIESARTEVKRVVVQLDERSSPNND